MPVTFDDITCRFCAGLGHLVLQSAKDGKEEIRRFCHVCAGTGLVHPVKVKDILRRFFESGRKGGAESSSPDPGPKTGNAGQ